MSFDQQQKKVFLKLIKNDLTKTKIGLFFFFIHPNSLFTFAINSFYKLLVNRSILSLSGLNYIDSSLKFEDNQFEDVSKFRKAFCWKYFLFNKANNRAKCNVKISEVEYCDRTYDAINGTSNFNSHLKKHHGIHADSEIIGI